MAYGKNGATCWLAVGVRTLQKRVDMLEAKDSFKNVECSIHANTSVSRHKLDGDFETQDTNPTVRVPRHKPAGDLVHGGVISGIRVPRPEGAAEHVVQFSPVRGCQQLTDEILQCGVVEDKINMFEKIGEGDGDRGCLESSLPLLIADVRGMWRVAGPVAVATESELAQISLSCRRNHLWKCNWRPHASFGTYTLSFETVGLSLLC